MVVDLFMVYSVIRRLASPFSEWTAFKLGIIDAEGRILKSRKDLTTIAERDALGLLDLMVLNLKRLLEMLPGGKTKLASYAAAMYLVRENSRLKESAVDHFNATAFCKGFFDFCETELHL